MDHIMSSFVLSILKKVFSKYVVSLVVQNRLVRPDYQSVEVPFVPVPEEKELEQKEENESPDCIICADGDNNSDGKVINCCQVCKNCMCHAHCFNRACFQAGRSISVPGQDGNEYPMDLRANRRCPACRAEGMVPVTYQPADKPPMDVLAHSRDWSDAKRDDVIVHKRLEQMVCEEGECVRIHPWTIFQMKWPRRLEKTPTGTFYYRVATTKNGDTLTARYRVLYEDDVVLETFGPFCKVREGSKEKQWPINWSNETWVRYAGKVAIRHLHGVANFNWDQVRMRMMEIITKDLPAWECLEIDCQVWCQSVEARDYCINQAQEIVKDKEEVEGLMFMKRAMSGPLSSHMILTIHKLIPYLPYLTYLEILSLLWVPYIVWLLYNMFGLGGLFLLLPLPLFGLYHLDIVTGLISGRVYEIPRLKVANSLKVWKSCSLGVKLPEMALGATLKLKRKLDMNAKCTCDRSLEVYGTIVAGIPAVVPMGCHHDIYNGLRIRYLFDRSSDPTTCAAYLVYCKNFLKDVIWSYWMPYSFLDWFLHLSGKRRKTLTEENNFAPLTKSSWYADIFVKGEAYVGKTWKNFKPRIIQCRKACLQLLIGPYFYSVLKWFSRTFSTGSIRYAPTMNALQLGEFVATQEGVPVEADASNWDGSVSSEDLEVEKFCLLNIVPYRPWWLAMLLQWWCLTTGSSQGVSYSCNWGRRSGDMWTSLFNSLLNILKTSFVWREKLNSLIINGDDSIFWVKDLFDLDARLKTYTDLGMKMEIFIRSSWRDIEFCSGRFYETSRGVKWGLKPWRQLCKFGFNFNRHSRRKFKSLLLGNALSMLPIAGHVPIFGIFLRRIVETAGTTKPLGQGREEWQITDTVVDDIYPAEEERFKQLYQLSDAEYSKLLFWANNIHIDNFPMVLEDPIFTKCASIDLGCQPTQDLSHYAHDLWYDAEDREESTLVIAWPLVEELLAWYWSGAWIVNGWFEFFLGSFWAPVTHFILNYVRNQYGFKVSVIFHLFLNRWLRANLLQHLFKRQCWGDPTCDGFANRGQKDRHLGGSRKPELFSSIRNCVGFVNNRLMRGPNLLYVIGLLLEKFEIKVKKSKSRSVKSTKVVVVKQKRTARRKRKSKDSNLSKIAKLIYDPCYSELVPGMYGTYGGYLSRCKSSFNFSGSNANGYIAWIPSYHGRDWNAGPTAPLNCFAFANASATTQPANNATFPLGADATNSSLAIAVGAAGWLQSSTVRDFRTLSACMRVIYTGTTSNCQGRCGLISNFPASQLAAPPSVAQMMAYAEQARRIDLEYMELKFRPGEETSKFRAIDSACFEEQKTGDPTLYTTVAEVDEPMAMVFVFRGIAADQLTFEFIQNIEWRPATGNSGFVENQFTQTSAEPLYRKALQFLDKTMPGWSESLQQVAGNVANNAINYVLGGAPQVTGRRPLRRILG